MHSQHLQTSPKALPGLDANILLKIYQLYKKQVHDMKEIESLP
jgi:hypothetical protein